MRNNSTVPTGVISGRSAIDPREEARAEVRQRLKLGANGAEEPAAGVPPAGVTAAGNSSWQNTLVVCTMFYCNFEVQLLIRNPIFFKR